MSYGLVLAKSGTRISKTTNLDHPQLEVFPLKVSFLGGLGLKYPESQTYNEHPKFHLMF